MDRDRRAYAKLLMELENKCNFDCRAHPMRSECSCPIAMDMPVIYEINTKDNAIYAWYAKFVDIDECFLYDGTVPSSVRFKTSDGRSPEDFARDYLRNQGPGGSMSSFWKPATTEDALVKAMLGYWVMKARIWRGNCHNRQEVRTKQWHYDFERGRMHRIPFDTMIARPMVEADDDTAEKDPLVRKVKYGPKGHERFAVLYAKAHGTGFGYDVVRCTSCHKQCGKRRITDEEILKATRFTIEKDVRRARAVKKDW